VTRSKKALPWPTKEQLKAAARAAMDDDLDLAEGETINYTSVHTRTGVVLGYRSGRPFSIDEIGPMVHANAQRIREADRAMSSQPWGDARAPRARARAPTA